MRHKMKIHGFCEIMLLLEICLLAAATAFLITGGAVINYGYNAEFVEPGAAFSAVRSTGEDILYRHHEHGHHGKTDAGETDLFDSFADESKSVDQMKGDTRGILESSKYTVTANNDEQEHNMPLKHGSFDRKEEALSGSSLVFPAYDGYETVDEIVGYGKENAHSSADGQLSITSVYGIPDDGHYNEIQHKKDVPSGSPGDVPYGSSADALPRFSRDVPTWSSGDVPYGSSGHILPGSSVDDPHGSFADVEGYDEDESIDKIRGDCKDSIESFEAESADSGSNYGYQGHGEYKLPRNGYHNEASYKGETSLASNLLQGKKGEKPRRNGTGGSPGYPPDPPGYPK